MNNTFKTFHALQIIKKGWNYYDSLFWNIGLFLLVLYWFNRRQSELRIYRRSLTIYCTHCLLWSKQNLFLKTLEGSFFCDKVANLVYQGGNICGAKKRKLENPHNGQDETRQLLWLINNRGVSMCVSFISVNSWTGIRSTDQYSLTYSHILTQVCCDSRSSKGLLQSSKIKRWSVWFWFYFGRYMCNSRVKLQSDLKLGGI